MDQNKPNKTKELLDKVHTSIVDVITKGIENGTISDERAKEIARVVLERLPENISYDELIRIIPKLDDDFQELSTAIVPIMLEYETKLRTVVNEKISHLLKQQKFKEAHDLAKRAIEYEKSLT